jgi:hypothetical protein
MGRAREGPKQFLQQFDGILQTDGYTAYDHTGGPKMIHAVCWAHSRRKFIDAVKLNPKDDASTRIVKLMDDLFAIDAFARQENLDYTARHALRLEKVPALLDDIRAQILAAQKNTLPKVRRGRPAATRSRCGTSSRAFWNTPSWSYPTIWPRTRCAPYRLAGRTGSIWVAPRPDPRLPQSYLSLKVAAG